MKQGKIRKFLGRLKISYFLVYHRAANPENQGKFMIYKRNPLAYWFDDYTELIEEYKING